MRNQNYGGSLAGLGPQRSPPTDTNEPSSPIMALMAGSWAPKESSQSFAEDIFTGSSSLMAGNTSSLMANPANPLHSGLRGLGLFSQQNILRTIKTKKLFSHVGAIQSPIVFSYHFFTSTDLVFCLSNLSVSFQVPVLTQSFFRSLVPIEFQTAVHPSSHDLPKLSNLSSTSDFPRYPPNFFQTSSSFDPPAQDAP